VDWGAFLSAFGLVFAAELGDKTQLAVLTQTCRFRRPWPVFLGACLALMAVTAIGVAGGEVLALLLPPQWVRAAAAVAFVFAGLWVARSAALLYSACCWRPNWATRRSWRSSPSPAGSAGPGQCFWGPAWR